MIAIVAPWLLSGLPLLGALATLAVWSRPEQVKSLAVTTAVISFASTVGLSLILTVPPEGWLLVYLLPLAALVSILGQPVEPEHRSAWSFTLVFLGLGLAALTSESLLRPLSLCVLFGLVIGLLYRHHSALWPMSWWGIGAFVLGAVAAALSVVAGYNHDLIALTSASSLIVCAILLPLVPFHDGYFTALTRLPGNLPSFVVVLFPALGLHVLVTIVPTVPAVIATTIMLFALIGALYGAFKALAQSRPRLLLAYGSLSFFSMMWWFAEATTVSTPSASVFVGAVAFGTSGLLIAWQVIRTRYGDDVDPSAISGLVSTMPRYAVLLSLLALAVMGLPPFGVFAGFIGLAFTSPVASSVALFGILIAWLISSWYILDAVQSLLFGRQRTDLRYTDVIRSEFAALLMVVLIVLALGLVPTSLWAPDAIVSSHNAVMGSWAWNR